LQFVLRGPREYVPSSSQKVVRMSDAARRSEPTVTVPTTDPESISTERATDGDRLMRDVRAAARRNLWALAAAGLLAGFALARFLKR
jgi:hypothetical protein